MTRILRFFTPITAICVVLLSAFSLDVKASHIAAVDITVRYAGTGPSDLTYDVIVDLYFACEANNGGGSPGPAGVVYFFSTNAGDAAYTGHSGGPVVAGMVI